MRKEYQRSCILLTVTPLHSRVRSRRESNNGIHARWLGEVDEKLGEVDAHHIWARQWKVDFYRFDFRVSMLAWVGRFSRIRSFHAPLSCADTLFRPSKFKSWLTQSPQVLLPLPLLFTPITSNSLQEDTQSSFLLRVKCPYHLSCPCVCTILGIPQKSKWRRNVTEFLHKLQIGPFYKIAELEHFISNGLATDSVQSLNFDGELPKIPV